MIVFTAAEISFILDRLDLLRYGPDVSPLFFELGEEEYLRRLNTAIGKWQNFSSGTLRPEDLRITLDALLLAEMFGDPDTLPTARSAIRNVHKLIEDAR